MNVRVSSTTVIEVKLKLPERHARWLMGALQNPVHGQSPEEEPDEHREIRIDLFEALREGLRK